MTDDEQTKMPGNSVGELALVATKVIASFIPFGGPAAEVLSAIITPRIERRRTEWLENVARGLQELSERFDWFTPEHLFQSEAFTTAFLQASQIAIRTHQTEKRQALKNAVFNVAIGDAPDDSLQLMFLNALDSLTPWHLRMLDCIADTRAWASRHDYPLAVGSTPDPAAIIEAFYREQLPVTGFQVQVLQDLYRHGLAANAINPIATLHSPEESLPHITDIGRKFLAFISSPIPGLSETNDEGKPA